MTDRPKKCPKCGGKLEGLRTKCWSGPYGNGCGWSLGKDDAGALDSAGEGQAELGRSTAHPGRLWRDILTTYQWGRN